jgi:hypothetical protein
MIDLDRFDSWPPDVDARKPDTWPSPVLLEVFEALTEIRAQELNPLEFAIVDHAYALVRRIVDRGAGKIVEQEVEGIDAGLDELLGGDDPRPG